jgi:ribonucleases P/MRP protein subunit RPP40
MSGSTTQASITTRNGTLMSSTEEERDIGRTVTKNLKPSAQRSKAAGRAAAVLGQLRKNFRRRDWHTFSKLYKQYIQPHLEFSATVWSPWLQGDIDTLERVQERAVKMVAGVKGSTYEEKCAELGLKTLKVVGNEKGGGSGSKLLLEYGFGPWRSMSV